MDKTLRQELNDIIEIGPAAIAASAGAGFATGRIMSMAICSKKFGRGTPGYKKCMSMKNTQGGKAVMGIKKGIDRVRGKKSVKETFEEVFSIEENRRHYLDLCKRKYSGLPEQYKKCRAAINKRFPR